LEIEGKINKMKFFHSTDKHHFIISTNDKTIKLWKFGELNQIIPSAHSSASIYKDSGKLVLPRFSIKRAEEPKNNYCLSNSVGTNGTAQKNSCGSTSTSREGAIRKKVYSNGHLYHINSLSTNSDRETFISADDLRINWWKIDISDSCFS
jgi:serine/threonine-protein phosphatase 2A regulatory subunit B